MGKKGDALNRLEADLNNLKNTTIHRFSAIDQRFTALESRIDGKLSAMESRINERFSMLETMLHQFTHSQTRSPAPGTTVYPDLTQMETEDRSTRALAPDTQESPKENPVENKSSFANGKRKTDGSDVKTLCNSIAAKRVKPTNEAKSTGYELGKNVGTSRSASSATSVTNELTKAISMLKTPEDLVEFESIIGSLKMTIIVKTATRRTLTLKVESSETIDNVKAKIYDMIRVPPYEQELILGTRILEGYRNLASYNIQKDSILNMILCSPDFQLYVITLRGEKIAIPVIKSDTFKDVKAKIHEIEGIPPQIQKLVYSGKDLEDAKTINVCHLWYNDPVHLTLHLPEVILQAKSSKDDTQKSMRIESGEAAPSGSLINEIVHAISMHKNPPAPKDLTSNKFVIFVEDLEGGKIYNFEVEKSDTIDSLKVKFYDKAGLPLHNQRFFFEKKQLEGDKTLDYYNIRNESALEMLFIMGGMSCPDAYIYVVTLRGEKIAFPVEISDTVNVIKAKIYEKEGIPPHIQKLVFSGKVLNNSKHLYEYRLYTNESTIGLTLHLPGIC